MIQVGEEEKHQTQNKHGPHPVKGVRDERSNTSTLITAMPATASPAMRAGLSARRNPTPTSAAANTSHHALTARPAARPAVWAERVFSWKKRWISPVTPNRTMA